MAAAASATLPETTGDNLSQHPTSRFHSSRWRLLLFAWLLAPALLSPASSILAILAAVGVAVAVSGVALARSRPSVTDGP